MGLHMWRRQGNGCSQSQMEPAGLPHPAAVLACVRPKELPQDCGCSQWGRGGWRVRQASAVVGARRLDGSSF